jgi:hypothetical protein
MIVLLKDLRGYRLGISEDDGKEFFKLVGGETVGKDKCWPATTWNIETATLDIKSGGRSRPKMKQLEQGYQMDLDPAELVAIARRTGLDLDSDLRLRMKMTPPFIDIEENDVMPLIATHLKVCEDEKKDPAKEPIELLKIMGQLVFKSGDKAGMGKHEGGRISLFNNTQVILSFGDWHFVPKNSRTGVFVQYLKCEPTGATSIKELCGKDKFLADDGVLCTWGLKQLVHASQRLDFKDELESMSVDDMIKGIEL